MTKRLSLLSGAVLLALALFGPATADMSLLGVEQGASIPPTMQSCPYGTGLGDGCGTSPGLYFAPAVNVSRTQQPTAAQWAYYAQQSSQTWAAPGTGGCPGTTTYCHPTHNLAGVDYGVGPSVPVSSLADIAGYNTTVNPATGDLWPQDTQCVYTAAVGNTWNGTASISGVILTVVSTGGGTLTVGMDVSGTGLGTNSPAMTLVQGPNVNAGLANSTQFLISYNAGTRTNLSYTATDNGPASVPSGTPALICSGYTSRPSFTISGWNFGPTTGDGSGNWAQGSPVGTHDCAELDIQPGSGTGYTPPLITVINNAFINGTTCTSNVINAYNATLKTSLLIINNFFDGRNDEPCCTALTQGAGSAIGFKSLAGNYTQKYNYFFKIVGLPFGGQFVSGANEPTCTNGTPMNNNGYVLTDQDNYYENFGYLGGGGHWELHSIDSQSVVCAIHDDYNTVLWSSTMAAAGEASYFGHNDATQSTVGPWELWTTIGNYIVTNLAGGAPTKTEYYNWHSDGCGPSHTGNCPTETVTAAATGGPWIGTSITLTACPTNTAFTSFQTLTLSDTTQSQTVGTITGCSGSVATVTSNEVSGGVANGDSLSIACSGSNCLNHIVVDAPSSGCGSACAAGPKMGQFMAVSAVEPVLQQCIFHCGGYPYVFNAGCNQGGGSGTICNTSGESIYLTPGVSTPSSCASAGYNMCSSPTASTTFVTVVANDSIFEADHGSPAIAAAIPSVTANSSASNQTGTTISVTTCPTGPTAGMSVDDTSKSTFVGAFVSCSSGSLVVDGNAVSGSGIANNDTLTIQPSGSWAARVSSSGGGAGTSIGLTACPASPYPVSNGSGVASGSINVFDVSKNAFVGHYVSCSGGTMTLAGNAITIGNNDYLAFGVPSYGQIISTGNFVDSTGQNYYFGAHPQLAFPGGFSVGGGGGCANTTTLFGNYDLTTGSEFSNQYQVGMGTGC